MNEQNTQTVSVPNLNLRNLLLRRNLNLSKSSWNQLMDSKWHDEIYVTRREDPFKRYQNLNYPVCTWKAVVPIHVPLSLTNKEQKVLEPNKDTVISKLESQINDLQTQVFILSLVNFGLVVFHLMK
jgi:hypothetical protein